jgi:hypothetical protein
MMYLCTFIVVIERPPKSELPAIGFFPPRILLLLLLLLLHRPKFVTVVPHGKQSVLLLIAELANGLLRLCSHGGQNEEKIGKNPPPHQQQMNGGHFSSNFIRKLTLPQIFESYFYNVEKVKSHRPS